VRNMSWCYGHQICQAHCYNHRAPRFIGRHNEGSDEKVDVINDSNPTPLLTLL